MHLHIVVFLLFYCFNVIISFNVQDIGNGIIIKSEYKGQFFGASIAYHENAASKW